MSSDILVHSRIPLHQLLEGRSYLGGRWIVGVQRVTQRNPTDGSGLRQIEVLSRDQLKVAVEQFSSLTQPQEAVVRLEQCRAWIDVIRGCQNALAMILASESGQSWRESLEQIRRALVYTRPQLEAPTRSIRPTHAQSLRIIHPGQNAPVFTALRTSLSAIVNGQQALVIATPQTALTLLALAVIADRCQLAPGAFNVVGRIGAHVQQRTAA